MRRPTVRIGGKWVGDWESVFIIAEIGINHNGSLDLAKELIDGAVRAGCDAVKFQKRTPEICVPLDQWYTERDTPWGRMSYIEYRRRVEFDLEQYAEIDRYCRERKILWFASCWDDASVNFMEAFDPPCYKIASASVSDLPLLEKVRSTGKPAILSTGMSTIREIELAVATLGTGNLLIAHTTSTYPCPLEELNLRMIYTLRDHFPSCPIGYSGHEVGLAPTWAAVAMGASFVERHITLDRSLWGSDQAASVEVTGFERLVENIRDIERAQGDGIKRVYESELTQMKRLRKLPSAFDAAAHPVA